MKLKIEKLAYKNGETNGKKWTRIGVFYNDKWYNCFKDKWNESWSEGDEIEVDVEESEYNGKIQYTIKKQDIFKILNEINRKLDLILGDNTSKFEDDELPPF